MNNSLVGFFVSKLMGWILVLVVGSYFLFSIDRQFISSFGPVSCVSSFFKMCFGAIRIPKLSLGIDLQGGTYVVLGVDIEKAIENKLGIEGKSLDGIFKEKGLKTLPTKKEIKNQSIVMDFEDEECAKICYNLVQAEASSLRASLDGNQVSATISDIEKQRIKTGSVEQVANVLNNRLSGFGVEGISVSQHGDRQVVVQIPGVSDPERVRNIITKAAHLEFKIVEKMASSKEELLDDFEGDLPKDKVIVPAQSNKKYNDGDEGGRWFLVSAFPDLTGERLVDAKIGFDEFNRVEVIFQLDAQGAKEFRKLTGDNIGKNLGIIVDDVVISSATVQTAIGANGRITGMASPEAAKDLSLMLRSGALPAQPKFEQENRVGASLGQDAIRNGLLSCVVALILLLFFSIFYYKVAGVFAVFALIFNLFLILLFLSYFNATLTLPGIAGMVLTIGMAIDASILIYERMKEELAQGATYRNALKDGFSGAMAVILDANVTHFLTGLVLFKFGGPAIRGFAITLIIGVAATVLTGIYFLRSIFDFILDNTNVKNIKI